MDDEKFIINVYITNIFMFENVDEFLVVFLGMPFFVVVVGILVVLFRLFTMRNLDNELKMNISFI